MSDNVTNLKGKPKKKRSWKLPVLLLLVLAVLAAAVWYLYFRDESRPISFLDGKKTEKVREMTVEDVLSPIYSFDADSNNRFGMHNDSLLIASGTGLSVLGAEGELQSQISGKLETPALSYSDAAAVAFDAGGTHLYAQSLKNANHLELTVEQPILDADVAEDGHFAYLGNESGYHSVLYVYDAKMNPVYTRWSASRFFSSCALDPEGNYAAVSVLGQDDGTFASSLLLFSTASEEPVSETKIGPGLVYDLHFVKDDMICAVCEDRTVFIRTDGTVAGTYDYQGAKLKSYAFGNDGFLTLLVNKYQSGSSGELVTVDFSGKMLAVKAPGSQVLSMSAAGDRVAVLMSDALVIYDSELSVVAKANHEVEATDVLLKKDGSAILLSGNAGHLCRF